MQSKPLLIVAATLALFGAAPQASADILEADFTGTTGASFGSYFGFGCTSSIGCVLAPGTPFTFADIRRRRCAF
jgi:hypothetical protein